MSVPGYSYYSYSQQSAVSNAGGMSFANGASSPTMLTNFINYNDPSNPVASMRILYGSQMCAYNSIEGGGGFQGYDYWQQSFLQYQELNYPLYFQYKNDSQYGLCLEYAVDPGGNVTYTLIFQNSTGYLLNYISQGHELCCPDGVTCGHVICPGNKPPVHVSDYSNTAYSNYIVLGDNYTWSSGFFDQPNCPYSNTFGFPTSTPTKSPSTKLENIILL
jgi:hypothetical protein